LSKSESTQEALHDKPESKAARHSDKRGGDRHVPSCRGNGSSETADPHDWALYSRPETDLLGTIRNPFSDN
jgi:hypothetical protein